MFDPKFTMLGTLGQTIQLLCKLLFRSSHGIMPLKPL